jgi:16S rRNA C1402 (ribose-2'-O) methylase RsmI
MKLDEIDKHILEKIEEFSGCQPAFIAREIGRRSEQIIRGRINALDTQGAVLQDRQKERGKVFVYITPYGKELLEQDCRPATEAEQHG